MVKQKLHKENKMVIYQTKSGALELRGDASHETIWATLDQMAEVFERDKSVISRHLKNIFLEGELDKKAVVAKNATTAKDGKIYQVEYYNLDAVISVGYRVNSKVATRFRQGATTTLREHITKGYTINRKRVAQNYDAFMTALTLLIAEISSPKVNQKRKNRWWRWLLNYLCQRCASSVRWYYVGHGTPIFKII